MEQKTRLTGDNFHKKGGKNILSISMTGSSFYLHENKTETYPTLIQMLKSDLIQIQDMINNNSSDIKMYKLLNKTPGLTKKLTEIEENKNIKISIDKMAEDSKNIDKISKIYGCKNQELISKLYLELSYNELLLKKFYDYFTLMKLKLCKDDTYQQSLSRVIPIQSFMEKASNLVPTTGSLDDRILQLSMEKEKLNKELNELKKKNMSNNESINENNNKIIDLKEKEINKLKKENENLKQKIEEEKEKKSSTSVNNSTIFETEVKFKDSQDFKKILQNFESETKKSRAEFCNKINEEIKDIKTKFNKLEENYNVINEERKSLKQNIDKIRNKSYDPDSYEEVLREQFDTMKNAFLKKIELLDEELNDVKQESRVKLYQMEEEMKESNYLKNVFLNQVITLQSKLEK